MVASAGVWLWEHLNHTFALSCAHTRFRVGSHQQLGVAQVGSDVFFQALVEDSQDSSRGTLPANGWRTLAVSDRCFPRSDLKRTVCERLNERFANAWNRRCCIVEGMKHNTFLSDRSPGRPMSAWGEANTPSDRLSQVLRMPAVVAATGLSRTTLWRLRQTGEFPTPVRLGGDTSRAVGWLRSDIEAWIHSRPAA